MFNNQQSHLKKNKLRISNDNKNRPIVIFFTGLNEQCTDFDSTYQNSFFSSFSDNYNVKCFNITTYNIDEINKFQNDINICEIKSIFNQNKSKKKNIIIAHSYGCIIALDIVYKLKLDNDVIMILLEPTVYKFIEKNNTLTPLYNKIKSLNNSENVLKCPMLVFTYFQNKKIIDLMESMNKNLITQDISRFNRIINLLQSNVDHQKGIIEIISYNPNIKIAFILNIKSDKNPHFIHKHNPDYIIKKIKEFLNNIKEDNNLR